MSERGQASIEWLGVVALVALVLVAAVGVVGGRDIGAAVVRQFERALCIVRGGVCDLDQRPCPVAVDATEDSAHMNLGIVRIGRDEAVLVEHRSDGTVLVTYLGDTSLGLETGAGADAWIDAAGISKTYGATARAALLVSLGGGESWSFDNARDADVGMSALGEGREPLLGRRAERIDTNGIVLTAHAHADEGTRSIALDARLVEGTVVDERDGRRTHVLTRGAALEGALEHGDWSGEAGATGDQRIAVTTDADGRPLELSILRTGELSGALRLPEDLQPIAGELIGDGRGRRRWAAEQRLDLTVPQNLDAVRGLLEALDGPEAMVASAGEGLRRRIAEAGVLETRTYGVEVEDGGLGAHVGAGWKLGGGLRSASRDARLVDARVRGSDGIWRTRTDCLAS